MSRTATQPQTLTTIGHAFEILGIVGSVSSPEEIVYAFRRTVKAAATGTGSYQGDMDLVRQAKAFLLQALARVQEQERVTRARQQEQQARRSTKPKQRHPPARTPNPHLLSAPSPSHAARVAFEREQARAREVIRQQWTEQQSREHARLRHLRELSSHRSHPGASSMSTRPASQEPSSPEIRPASTDPLENAMALLQQRRQEVTHLRAHEHELQQTLQQVQQQRQQQEQVLQSADHLLADLHALLSGASQTHRREP